MAINPLGSGVSRFINGRDRQLGAVVFEANKPILDSELNLISLAELEARAETVRSALASGWLMDEADTKADYFTDPSYSNLFYFGRQTSGEVRNLPWAVVNGWLIPVAGTQTGAPPLSPNDTDTWNRVELNPPNTSTGGNRAEFVFLEVWLQRIDVDPAPPTIAPGKPQRGFIYRFGNVEGGFSYLPDDLIDPDFNYETTKRVQIQYRIRVVADINVAQYPEGFDQTLVFARGPLTSTSAIPFENMREQLGDPGLWRAGTGDPATFGTVDGYVYAIPMSAVFRRNSAGFSDVGNLAGAFNRNSLATSRDGATVFTSSILLPVDIAETDVSFTLTSISGTVLNTINSFGEAYFKIDDEIIRVNNVTQTGPTAFDVTMDRGQLQTTIRSHLSGTELVLYTVRPDGLFADQISQTDVLDLRHSVADKFDYDSILKTNLTELMKGNLRTAWKRYGSTNSAGPVVFYGDRVTDSTIFVGGLSRLDAPNGNRRAFSDSIITERFNVAVQVPLNSSSLGDSLEVAVNPYVVNAEWLTAASGHPAGSRLNGTVSWWYNGDRIRIHLSDFQEGMPAGDSDQVRFVLPSEDEDAVLVHFEGMTTDPNGGEPSAQPFTTAPSATNPDLGAPTLGNRILKHGQGIDVSLDVSGNLVILLDSGTAGDPFQEFDDTFPPVGPASQADASRTLMHVSFAVVYGAGRGLSHKPDYIHTVHYRGNPTNSSKALLRPGLSDKNRMVPIYLNESPRIQTGKNRDLARTSEVMVDPGSKTVWAAPYRNVLVPELLMRDGSELNWTDATTFQGAMPPLSPDGLTTVHTTVDPLSLFFVTSQTRYAEIPMDYLPRPGLHHVPIVPITTATFPSGINFILMSKEGPMLVNSSNFNRNLVSYPSTAGYYIVTPVVGETYGTASGSFSVFGQKYENQKLRSVDGGPFKGIQFPPFYGPARITGVYVRDTSGPGPYPVVPTASPFDANRIFVGGIGTDTNLLRDDFDGPVFLLEVDENGDLTFILNADVLDLTKATSGTTFENAEFLIECTLFGFDRGFLQTNGRLLGARTSSGGSLETAIDTFTDMSDDKIGIITPAPMALNSVNNELTVYYSRQPYQGDVFGSQNAYSDDLQRLGPLTISEATSLFTNTLGPAEDLALQNKAGYEVLAALNFVSSLGSGRLSGSNPIPLLTTAQNPDEVEDYPGTLVDLDRKFSLNRVGFEDWVTPKFPVLEASVAARPDIDRDAISEVFDRDVNPEFAGSIAHLPLGAYFRDKDFIGKTLYQTRSSSNVGTIALGTMAFPPYQAPTNPTPPGHSSWEGTEFVCGQASGLSGVGGEALVKVDGTSTSFSDITKFKTARGGAGWSLSDPWPGGAISSRLPKARPNTEVGSILAGTAYLVRSQPETLSSVEVHPGHELQMIIVTRAVPAYFRDTDILHSASGVNEGFTALDRFRIWGRPLEKRRGTVDVGSAVPGDPPLFVNDIFDDPIFFGSSDIGSTSPIQTTLPITSAGQTAFTLPSRPLDPTAVMAWARGVKLVYGVDYTVTGFTDQDFTYIVHGANPALLLTDTLEVWYIEL
jgi:hypothetical protein